MDFSKIQRIYFIGIGGIGMSALARYFLAGGFSVAGYDRVSTPLTEALSKEGCLIHFKDDPTRIPAGFRNSKDMQSTLVVYTPAIPSTHKERVFFQSQGFLIIKRAELLGIISGDHYAVAVAGTHGKTTITALIAHILKQSELDCTAFVGGILKNYNTNLILGTGKYAVLEADEFDRSFLYLHPSAAVITSIDKDHLDVYGDISHLLDSFRLFAEKIKPGGFLIMKRSAKIDLAGLKEVEILTYGLDKEADYYAENLKIENGFYVFDLIAKNTKVESIRMGYPGKMNVENAVAACAVTMHLGVPEEIIRKALFYFRGVQRRFDIRFKNTDMVYIDDYAHHPAEISFLITSVREMYPGKKISGIFQPHLYSRTKDFASEFADSLSRLDELVLLDIYPAREQPIPGISSLVIFEQVHIREKKLLTKEQVPGYIVALDTDILLTIGAGDIDRLIEPIMKVLNEKYTNMPNELT